MEKDGVLSGTIESPLLSETYRYDAVIPVDDDIQYDVIAHVIMDKRPTGVTVHRGMLTKGRTQSEFGCRS